MRSALQFRSIHPTILWIRHGQIVTGHRDLIVAMDHVDYVGSVDRVLHQTDAAGIVVT